MDLEALDLTHIPVPVELSEEALKVASDRMAEHSDWSIPYIWTTTPVGIVVKKIHQARASKDLRAAVVYATRFFLQR
jgi:hypothetical protein